MIIPILLPFSLYYYSKLKADCTKKQKPRLVLVHSSMKLQFAGSQQLMAPKRPNYDIRVPEAYSTDLIKHNLKPSFKSLIISFTPLYVKKVTPCSTAEVFLSVFLHVYLPLLRFQTFNVYCNAYCICNAIYKWHFVHSSNCHSKILLNITSPRQEIGNTSQ